MGLVRAADSLVIDSSEVRGIEGNGIRVEASGYAAVWQSRIADTDACALRFERTPVVEVGDSTTVLRGGSNGITASFADTVRVSNASFEHMAHAAVGVYDSVGVLEVSDVAVSQAFMGVWADILTTATVVRRSTFDEIDHVALFVNSDSVTVDSVTVTGSQWGVALAYGSHSLLDLRRSTFKRLGSGGLYSAATDTVRVQATTMDSLGGNGIYAWDTHSLSVYDLSLNNIDGDGVDAWRSHSVSVLDSRFSNVSFDCVSAHTDTTIASSYVEVLGSVFRDCGGDGVDVSADSVLLSGDSIIGTDSGIEHWFGGGDPPAWLRVENSYIGHSDYAGIYADMVETVEIHNVEVEGTGDSDWYYPPYAIEVYGARTARVESSFIHDNFGGSVGVWDTQVFTARDDTVARSNFATSEPNGLTDLSAIYLEDVDTALVRASKFIDNVGAGVRLQYYGAAGVATVDSSSFQGRYWGVRAQAYDTLTGHLEIRDNSFAGILGDTLFTRQIGLGPLRTMIVEGNTIDSINGYSGIGVWPGDTITVRNNVLTNVTAGSGIYSERGATALLDSNSVTCADSNSAFGIVYHAGGGAILGNSVNQCRNGIFSGNTYGFPFDLSVRANSVARGAAVTATNIGIQVQSGGYNAAVVGNTITGVGCAAEYSTRGAISVVGTGVRNRSVRVDSNTVPSGCGRGIRVWNADTILIRNNSITGLVFDPYLLGPPAGISLMDDMWTSAFLANNTITGNAVPGIEVNLNGVVGEVVIDTNLIADNDSAGIMLLSPASGTLNSIRRNAVGILDTAGTGSVFQSNNFEGNGFGVLNLGATALDASNSWWGDVLGPQCVAGCDAASTGDSVSANVTFLPFATSVIAGAPVGAPPVAAASAARRTAQLLAPARFMRLHFGLEEDELLPDDVPATGGGGVGRNVVPSAAAAARAEARALRRAQREAAIRKMMELPPRRPERRR